MHPMDLVNLQATRGRHRSREPVRKDDTEQRHPSPTVPVRT
jgi:hypothetical protein